MASVIPKSGRGGSLEKIRRVFWCLLGPCCLATCWFLVSVKPQRVQTAEPPFFGNPTIHTQQPVSQEYLGHFDAYNLSNFILESQCAPEIDAHSLTAILPVSMDSLPTLEDVLSPFLSPSTRLHEIIVACPEAILSQTRRTLHKIVVDAGTVTHPDISLRPWAGDLDQNTGVMHISSQVSTEWMLLLHESGLKRVSSHVRDMLLVPKAVAVPVGPHGVVSADNIIPSRRPQRASYLIPPFVVPSSLVHQFPQSNSHGLWASLGDWISQLRPGALGGIVMASADSGQEWCPSLRKAETSPPHGSTSPGWEYPYANETESVCTTDRLATETVGHSGVFALVFPTLKDLQLFSMVACRFQDDGHMIQVLLYDEPLDYDYASEFPSDREERTIASGPCLLKYNVRSVDTTPPINLRRGNPFLFEWFNTLESQPDVILSVTDQDSLSTRLASLLKQRQFPNSTLIHISQRDLPYCAWMSSLSLNEWRSWHIPKIDVSIITKDRPQSLARLLSSLSKGIFFGDALNLRVNLEQSADADTLQMVDNFQWEHGALFVHHRVVHGGLLPAVVESWYPHSNDTYGLLLEDDVEVSPLFYAWVKMSVLRYRYDGQRNNMSMLFGISLYQQKNIELRPDGRKPFNARALFSDAGIPHPSTPYLSQIPCSWGAVYFPEHWREFHSYLSVRLSEYLVKIEQDIVPDVRSNNWTKSWKKYFVELVYLRGYVMLYPNYQDFISLSTNHLEVGSHVKERSKEKQDLFLLPLMKLPDARAPLSSGLLDLPDQTLPVWHRLPILNLTGGFTTLESIAGQGRLQRAELFGCSNHPARPYDVRDLMCIDSTSHS